MDHHQYTTNESERKRGKHLTCITEWHRCENRVQYVGTCQRRLYAGNLHPRHKQGAGTGCGEDGKFDEAGAVTENVR